jgi:transposase
VRILIEEDPNPHRIQRMSEAEISALFKKEGGRCGVKTAERIKRVFDQMVLPPEALSQIAARRVQAEYALFRQREARIAQLLDEKIVGLVSQTDAAVLLTVPGTSPALVARYIACLRDQRRFPSAAHIWSYAGFDPQISQSGNHKRTYQISRQGDPFLRDTLFRLGYAMAQYCPPVQAAFVKAIERGLNVRAATIHAARKANRILFALLQSQQPFVNPLSAEKSDFWYEQYQRVHPKTQRVTP